MQMTEQEIVIDYKRAANHKEKIKILSELNACPKDEIERILRENGLMKYFLKNKDMSVELPKIKKLLQEGKSQKDIAVLYDTTQPKISSMLKILDVNESTAEDAKLSIKDKKILIDKAFEKIAKESSEKLELMKAERDAKEKNVGREELNQVAEDCKIPELATGGIVTNIDFSPADLHIDEMLENLKAKNHESDNVNHPQHYCVNGLECLDIMKEVFGADKVQAFCVLNAFKYLFRFQRKNGDEDIKKAHFYLGRYIQLMEKENI